MTVGHRELHGNRQGSRSGPLAALVNFPDELKARRRWVAWRSEILNGKSSKRPLQRVNYEGKWLSYPEARDFVVRGEADGVGFVLGDGIVGIDLDACINVDGTLHAVARDAIEMLGTYAEKSPSGRGLHLLIQGAITKARKISKLDGIPGRELYDGRKGSARFFTVTGERLGNAHQVAEGPRAQAALDAFVAKWFVEAPRNAAGETAVRVVGKELDDDDVLETMFRAVDGARWRAIFYGDYSCYGSQSEADLALCRKLRFYVRANAAQMDRLFRRSGLMRGKWDERRGTQTYGEGTIAKALAAGGRLYRLPPPRYSAETLEGQFGKVHRSTLATLALLNKTEILAYIALAIHANAGGECHPTAARIAEMIGTTREHAQAAITTLQSVDLASATPNPGKPSVFQLTAFKGVSKFDTRQEQGRTTTHVQEHTERNVDPRRRSSVRRTAPVSKSDTLPVSKFDTRTDKEQTINTVGGGAVPFKAAGSNVAENAHSKTLNPNNRGQRLDAVPSDCADWDGTATTPAGVAFLWSYAEQKLGLIGPRYVNPNGLGGTARRNGWCGPQSEHGP